MRTKKLFKFNNRPTIFVKQLSMGIHGPINVSVIKITEVKITSNVDQFTETATITIAQTPTRAENSNANDNAAIYWVKTTRTLLHLI